MTGTPLPTLPVSRLLLWRHGRTEWNATGRFQGQLDPPLDAVGRDQALRAAPALVASGLAAEDTVVVSSDLSRAAETAATLSGLLGVPLLEDPRLREHGLGCWEGLTRDEVADDYPDQYADWLAGRPVRGRGGEEPAHVAERALAALADLPPARVAVVVTHGGTAGRLVERLLGLGPDHHRVFGPLANCAWSELAAHGPRWRLLRHNSSVLPLPDGHVAAFRSGAAPTASAPVAAVPGERNPAEIEDADAVG
ncbi:MAG TPA: histidine phosphatase family protein [Blastococcus sp.]|nr:histidine phosphatase family protein [Blastococcus sp.]